MKVCRSIRLLAVLGLALLVHDNGRGQQERNLQPDTLVPPRLLANGNYYALVIGIDHYPSPLPSLVTAVNDATAIADVLRKDYEFKEITLLVDGNATRSHILDTINDYRTRLNENDNLLIYYAGHGYSDQVTNKAYWIPADANSKYSSNRIIADDLTSAVADQNALHVLIISDSCYSGGLTRSLNSPTESAGRMLFINRMLGRRSRTLMASGGDEPVFDSGTNGHSVFAYALLHSLEQPDQPIFTASDLLYGSVRHEVAGKSSQVPQYAYIRNSNDAQGDFVFVRKGVQLPTLLPTTPQGTTVEQPPPPADADMSQIRDLLARYANAVNSRDTKRLKSVWPEVPGSRLVQIKRLPKGARITLAVAAASLLDTNDNAVVRCKQTLDQDGKTTEDYVTFYVGRFNAGWIINQIPSSN
jgi:uncharacterized caspase-like protein